MKNYPAVMIILACSFLSASAQTDIRKVDFKNFTYEAGCAGEDTTKITVKNGEFSEEEKIDAEITARFYFKIFDDIAYGDMNGDGKDEAVILSLCNTGGSGNFTEGFIYTLKNGKPAMMTGIGGGDRAYGGLKAAKIKKRTLILESYAPSDEGGACCPEFIETSKYNLKGNTLKAIGTPTRREIYPASRIAFAKGASSTVVKVILPAGESKRFVIGARAGQQLSVSSNAKNVSIALIKGEANSAEVIGAVSAKLLKNGDYTFQVDNGDDIKREISLTVKID